MAETKALPAAAKWGELVELFGALRPYRGRFTLAVAASLVSMTFGSAFPWLVGYLVDAALHSLKPVKATLWNPTVDEIALILLGTLLVQAVLTYFSSQWFNQVGEQAGVDLRSKVFSRLVSLPMRFFGERRVGELTSRLSSDLLLVQDLFAFTTPQLIRQTMLFGTGGIALVLTSPRLSLVMACSVPPVFLTAFWLGRKVRARSRETQDRLAEASTVAEETLQNIASVKAFTNERFERDRYRTALDRLLASVFAASELRARLIALIIAGIFGSIILVLWNGAKLMEAGLLSHGELTRFTLFTILLGGSVASGADIFSVINRTLGAGERLRELLREAPEFSDLDAVPAPSGGVRLQGDVVFEEVRFRYPSRPDLPVLNGVNLHARAGEKIALVGPSGAGKSTIVSLLLRFYAPSEGRILFDGKPAEEYDLAAFRSNLAIVPQEVMLFGGSIRENIAYGKPGASEAEIRDAAVRAHCHEFIERFPEGYETVVGERGVQLSGGQRQRVAIARALLKNPTILILDEATSALDSESERLVQQALETLLQGRTAFVIAHRLSTIREVDRICVIQDGIVTESGPHSELLQREGGAYRRLSELQLAPTPAG